jgi:hypothetical protein
VAPLRPLRAAKYGDEAEFITSRSGRRQEPWANYIRGIKRLRENRKATLEVLDPHRNSSKCAYTEQSLGAEEGAAHHEMGSIARIVLLASLAILLFVLIGSGAQEWVISTV